MKLTKDYQDGYTKALLDMDRILAQYEDRLSELKVISRVANHRMRRILDAMIIQRHDCMKHGVKSMTLVRLKDKKTFKLKFGGA